MNKKFIEKLEEFLYSEIDYDIDYEIEYTEDNEATVLFERHENEISVDFKYSEKEDQLYIDMYDSNWQDVSFSNFTVKYFWIIVSPKLFK